MYKTGLNLHSFFFFFFWIRKIQKNNNLLLGQTKKHYIETPTGAMKLTITLYEKPQITKFNKFAESSSPPSWSHSTQR